MTAHQINWCVPCSLNLIKYQGDMLILGSHSEYSTVWSCHNWSDLLMDIWVGSHLLPLQIMLRYTSLTDLRIPTYKFICMANPHTQRCRLKRGSTSLNNFVKYCDVAFHRGSAAYVLSRKAAEHLCSHTLSHTVKTNPLKHLLCSPETPSLL